MQHIINLKIDDYSEMATIYLDNKLIMTGNFWDFHPECHDIKEWGEFRGYLGLVRVISEKISKKGETVKLIKENYSHEKNYYL
jgi:hypothetical protein